MLQNLYDGILILYLIINNKYENIVLNNATLAASDCEPFLQPSIITKMYFL